MRQCPRRMIIRAVGEASQTQGRPRERFLYDRDLQLTRTDLWAWTDAVRRVETPASAGHTSELLEAMRDPQFYDADPHDTVELRETHSSWVFLVDERAFKLKKPLVLPFLDYSSVERRRLMCQREVALNRPLAGDLYRGVRSIVRRGGRLRLAADTPDGIEHVVEMRRYDEDATLAAALARGLISPGDIRPIAERLARFHAGSAVHRHGAGTVARLKRAIDGNFETLLAQRDLVDPVRVLSAQRFVDAFLAGHGALLVGRDRAGWVRECHGDLRAKHVLLGEQVQIVDCIEYADDLREIDVAEDLALLIMDLTRGGRPDLARSLAAHYRAAGGNPGSDQMLAFHAAVGAWARAKLAALRAVDPMAGKSTRIDAAAEARELFGIGEHLSWQARLPLALIVCGPPAAGKTALAAALAERSGLPVLSADEIRRRIAGLEARERAPRGAHAQPPNERTYLELGRLAAEQLAATGGVIVDATFGQRQMREAFASAFGEATPALFCECRAPLDVLRRRARAQLSERRRISDEGLSLSTRLAERFDPLEADIAAQHHLVLRADQPPAEVSDDLVAMLDRHLARAPVASTTTEAPA